MLRLMWLKLCYGMWGGRATLVELERLRYERWRKRYEQKRKKM